MFKTISFEMDKSAGAPGEVDLIVNVEERGRFELRGETLMGNQEGNVVCMRLSCL